MAELDYHPFSRYFAVTLLWSNIRLYSNAHLITAKPARCQWELRGEEYCSGEWFVTRITNACAVCLARSGSEVTGHKGRCWLLYRASAGRLPLWTDVGLTGWEGARPVGVGGCMVGQSEISARCFITPVVQWKVALSAIWGSQLYVLMAKSGATSNFFFLVFHRWR